MEIRRYNRCFGMVSKTRCQLFRRWHVRAPFFSIEPYIHFSPARKNYISSSPLICHLPHLLLQSLFWRLLRFRLHLPRRPSLNGLQYPPRLLQSTVLFLQFTCHPRRVCPDKLLGTEGAIIWHLFVRLLSALL